mgnify:CR=1 FL=1
MKEKIDKKFDDYERDSRQAQNMYSLHQPADVGTKSVVDKLNASKLILLAE